MKIVGIPPKARRIVLKRRLDGPLSIDHFQCEEADVPSPVQGEFLVKLQWISIDGFMVGRLRDEPNYTAGVKVGDVVQAYGVGRIEYSRSRHFAVGEYVYGRFGMQEWALSDGSGEVKKVECDSTHAQLHLGLLGISGWTAYVGLFEIGQVRPGETVLVSAGAGGVGAVVGQLASISGARAVAIVGSNDKVELAQTRLGYDAAVNRRDAEFSEKLDRACPDGVDVYFDNVGGTLYRHAIRKMNSFGRVVVCGRVADAQQADRSARDGYLDHNDVLVKRLRKQGFIVSDYQDQFTTITARMRRWWSCGLISLPEDVSHDISTAPEALIRLLRGENRGKQLVRVN